MKLFLPLALLVLTAGASAASLTVEILDEEGDRQSADLEIRNGEVIDSGETIEAELEPGETYTLEQEIDGVQVTFHSFSIQEDLDLRPRILDLEPDEFLIEQDPFYFNNQSEEFSFSEASITVQREEPDRIARCTGFESLECTAWEIEDPEAYDTSSNDEYTYNVTEFSAYATGNQAPKPELENIQIYDVTGEQEKRDNGELEDEGLESLEIIQEEERDYRFEFNVSNQGSSTWTLTADDLMEDQGFEEVQVLEEDIYYVLEEEYEDGEFEDGDVEWNTGEGGELEPGEMLSAEYITEIDETDYTEHEKLFKADTTSGTSEEQEYILETVQTGEISNVTIERPEDDSIVQNNREFLLNGTVECADGSCGETDVVPRTNTSQGMQELSNVDDFEILEDRSGCDLTDQDQCAVEWDVNASGDGFHELDLEASSEHGDVQVSDSVTVEIQDVLMIDVTPSEISFGELDPGESGEPADVNDQGHEVKVEEESNTVDNLWLKASDLVHHEEEQYFIGPGNMSYWDEPDRSQAENLSSEYTHVGEDLGPGSLKTFYYWIDVPLGILKGQYSGTLTFKANSTS